MTGEYQPQERTEPKEGMEAAAGKTTAVTNYGNEAAGRTAETAGQMTSYIGRLVEAARAEVAIGPVQQVNGHTVVPLAAISVQGGFGFGFGGGGGSDQQSNQGGGSGGGGGGGGRSSSRVIAVADISEHGVEIKPVYDVNTLALAGMALLGLAMLGRIGGRATRGRLLSMIGPG